MGSPRQSPLRPVESLEAREVPAAGLLADVNAVGSPAFAPNYPLSPPVAAVVGNAAYFFASDGTHTAGLFKSDGTAAGTHVLAPAGQPDGVAAVTEFGSGVTLTRPAVVGGKVYFTGDDGTHGAQLYASDGTDAGTVRLTTVTHSPPITGGAPVGQSGPEEPAVLGSVGGRVLFTIGDATNGRQLWATDGTAANTAVVRSFPKNIPTESRIGYPAFGPLGIAVVGGKLLFNADDGATGRQLWATDGTAAGTTMVKGLPSTATGYSFSGLTSGIDGLTDVGGKLYFTVDAKGEGQSLWRTDGTAAGTTLVKKINAAALADNDYGSPPSSGGSGRPWGLTAVGSRLYFVADDGTHGDEVWVSDGTAAGTVMVKDISTAAGPYDPAKNSGSAPADLTAFNGKVYFTASPQTYGSREVWATDGTEAGTARVAVLAGESDGSTSNPFAPLTGRPMTAVGGKLYLATGGSLWASDGTAAGTASLTPAVATPVPDVYGTAATQLTAAGSKVFFVRSDGTHGRQLWVSDGTAAGRFEVVADHVFAAAGKPTVTVTITAVGSGKTAAAASLFTIDAARRPAAGAVR